MLKTKGAMVGGTLFQPTTKKKKKVPEGTFIHKDRRQIGRLVLHCIVGCLDGNFTFFS
jgi:hypothetical protein